jgi:hypothetical protein
MKWTYVTTNELGYSCPASLSVEAEEREQNANKSTPLKLCMYTCYLTSFLLQYYCHRPIIQWGFQFFSLNRMSYVSIFLITWQIKYEEKERKEEKMILLK